MLYFENDYSEGAHEEVLKRLTETNMEQLPGYGTDRYTAPEPSSGPDIRFLHCPRQTGKYLHQIWKNI